VFYVKFGEEEAGNKEIIKNKERGLWKSCFFLHLNDDTESNKEVYILDKE